MYSYNTVYIPVLVHDSHIDRGRDGQREVQGLDLGPRLRVARVGVGCSMDLGQWIIGGRALNKK